ncbi:MAG: CPBP family intramembrane metalloprotease [Candidatus Micrarchaeota archaeon]|nr:CPBP family intramembrane metalloprotease [Candidatus Micrarchaeota archaeon]
MKTTDILLVMLPVILWPVSFILLRSAFIYALLASTFVLASISLAYYGKTIVWKRSKGAIAPVAAGLAGAAILYLIFYGGNFAVSYFGIAGLVGNVYAMIYGNVARAQLVVLLAFIGLFEEIYWRGALQSYVRANSKLLRGFPWVATTAYYTLVHISALNPILVVAAFFVGLVTSLMAERYGIISSIAAHIVWIELIVVFLPVL